MKEKLRKYGRRLISIMLVMAMFVQMLPMEAYAEEMLASNDNIVNVSEASDNVPIAGILGEVESLREIDTKHFRLTDGSYLAVSYGLPVHVQDDKGNWQDIDNSLSVSTIEGVTRYQTANIAGVTAFATGMADGSLFSTENNGYRVSMSLLDTDTALRLTTSAKVPSVGGSLGQIEADDHAVLTKLTYNRSINAEVQNEGATWNPPVTESSTEEDWTMEDLIPQNLTSSILYEEVFPNVDLRYTAYSHNIKEEIIIWERMDSYRFDFMLYMEDLTADVNSDGSISLCDREGQEIYYIPAPYMKDAVDVTSQAVSYTLTDTPSGTMLTVTADAQWINSGERAFPVTIDPSLVLNVSRENTGSGSSVYATYVTQAAPNAANGNCQELRVGYGRTDKAQEIFMHFHVMPRLPEGASVVGATLGMKMTSFNRASYTSFLAGVYAVTETRPLVHKNYYDWICNITWANQVDYDNYNMIDYVTIQSGQTMYEWDITELVKKWYHEGTDNRTIRIGGLNMNDSTCNSSNYASAVWNASGGSSPLLVVSYRNTTGIESYYTYQTLGAGEAGTVYIADQTGQVKVVKEILSYASTTKPFSLNLVYNSDYFTADNTAPYAVTEYLDQNADNADGIDMTLGSGWTLDVIEYVAPETVGGTSYIRYHDGDGTIHYFAQDSVKEAGYYYDEDGLGLKIRSTGSSTYEMSDDHGNKKIFTEGFLTSMEDADGNRYLIDYSNGRITEIRQKNKDCEEITVASFDYDSNGHITITDAAGTAYSLVCSGQILTGIQRNSQTVAEYGYDGYRLDEIRDTESEQELCFTYYDGGRVSSFYEQSGSTTGQIYACTYPGNCQTRYDWYGADRLLNTDDDIYTYYLFDYAGRTINIYMTDHTGNMLGATNAAYTGTGSTDKTNNRILRTASVGTVGQQYLKDSSFEGWGYWTYGNGTDTADRDFNKDAKIRGGNQDLMGTLTNTTMKATATINTEKLIAGKTYTLSAYVNTCHITQMTGRGVYLKIADQSGHQWSTEEVSYITSELVDDGWVRVHVTFTAASTAIHMITVNGEGALGKFYVDDLMLEDGDVPSAYNMLENGNMYALDPSGTGIWNWHNISDFLNDKGLQGGNTLHINVQGNVSSGAYSYQEVMSMLWGSETYVVSGWAKANAVPEGDQERLFGLIVTLYYQDLANTVEHHYVPFDPDVDEWQFTSGTIVPKIPGEVVFKIRVTCTYQNNANRAYFDDIALIRQPAQTMRYDADGNLVSVTTTGLNESVDTYAGGNLIQSLTGGYGTYDYTYGNESYPHRLTSVANGIVRQNLSYDGTGNVTNTTLQNISGTGPQLISSATYTGSGNLLSSVTDSAGHTLQYTYGDARSVMLGQPTAITDAGDVVQNMTYDIQGRADTKYIANTVSLDYNYIKGRLSGVIRTDDAGNTQTMSLGYDIFGNTTGISIGDIPLASYEYGAGNGLLKKQTYGNGDYVTYAYDNRERVTETEYADGRSLSYVYNGEGLLYSVTDDHGTDTAADDTLYIYTYDTLGRLIHCRVKENDSVTVEIHWEYDGYNRVSSQGWQMGTASYRESYTYSEADGSLVSITYDNGTTPEFIYAYDGLQRLTGVTTDHYIRSYTYRDIENADNLTTTQVSSLTYSGDISKAYQYTYNALGHIVTYQSTDEAQVSYTYDNQGQLTQAVVSGGHTYSYTYDSAGNILTAFDGTATDTYTYGNSSWRDLLTAYNGQNVAYEGQTYDADTGEVTGTPTSGNPISYYNGTRWTLDWAEGRNLISAQGTVAFGSAEEQDVSVSYTYDASGLRTSKTVTVETYELVETVQEEPEAEEILPEETEATVPEESTAAEETTEAEESSEEETTEGETTTEDLVIEESIEPESTAESSETETLPEETITEEETETEAEIGSESESETETNQEPETVEETASEELPTAEMSLEDLVEEEITESEASSESETTPEKTKTQESMEGESTSEEDPAVEGTFGEEVMAEDEVAEEITEPLIITTRTLVSYTTEHHDYIYAGGKLLRDTITTTVGDDTATEILDFRYDETGNSYALIHTEGSTTTTYYYITNLQGDVMHLVDGDGTAVASYTYDPYGNILTATGELAEVNPLRYRGYYYDGETGFYYLQSRYYDAEIERFLNADSYLSTGQSFLGHNAFAYCGNNPVNRVDADGEAWETIFDFISLGTSVAEVLAKPADLWAWAGLAGDVIDVLVPFVGGIGESVDALKGVIGVVEGTDDVVDAAKTVKKMVSQSTGSYEILYESGRNYIGKGSLKRAITSAVEHAKPNDINKYMGDTVKSITWKSASNSRTAFMDEYLWQKARGGVLSSNPNLLTYNKIWSPGRKYLE